MAGGAEIIGAARRLSRRPDRPAPTWRCIICWSASIPLGHWRLAYSDISCRRFLMSIRWRVCGSRIPAPSRPSIAWSKSRSRTAMQGLRLDHIDGLRDPAQYFQRLRRLIGKAQGKRRSRSTW